MSIAKSEVFVFLIQSKHDTAKFHVATRAIGGCAVYVRRDKKA